MAIDGLKNYYFNNGKEIVPKAFSSKYWLHDYSVQTFPLSNQKIPHLEAVFHCAGTLNVANSNLDYAQPYISLNASSPRDHYEQINTFSRLTGSRNLAPMTGERASSSEFRSLSVR